MYKLSKELIGILEKNNISYCHWKSNLLLNEALDGYDDLDLLVERKDIYKFEQLISSLNFKEASNSNIGLNAVKHFYGLDIDTGNILHLHVYYQIKTGPSWIKSYRFDFEEYFLENTIYHESGMKVPAKHIELVIFIFRIMLKYSKLNEFILISKEQDRTIKEIDYLFKGMNQEKMIEFLELYFPSVSKEDFFEYIEVIQKGSSLSKYLKAMQLKKQLSKYNIYTKFEEINKNLYQLVYRISNKIFFKQKKSLHSCGMLIVVAGLDATGKTTIINDLKKLLKKNFSLSMIHFGKPRSTFLTYPINLAIKLMRKQSNDTSLRSSKQSNKPKSFLYVIRQVVLAYDRYQLIKKSWNEVSNGRIVICDRYKSEDFGVMDSKRLNPNDYIGIKRKLASIENNLYSKMPQPDILFYLTAPVDVAVERNETRIKEDKEDEKFLRIRHEENKNLTYLAKEQYQIDTNKEYKEVISNIKQLIWNKL